MNRHINPQQQGSQPGKLHYKTFDKTPDQGKYHNYKNNNVNAAHDNKNWSTLPCDEKENAK